MTPQQRTASAGLVLAASTLVGDLKRQCAFDRFTTGKSVVDYAFINTQYLGPFCEGHSFSKCFKEYAVSLVSRLLLFCRPLAIVRGVVSIGLYPINGVFFSWSKTHISDEILKYVPLFAHANSSATVILKSYIGMIFTSSSHVGPCPVFFCSSTNPGMTVMNIGKMRHLLLKTATRFSITVDKFGAHNNRFITAVANTEPFGVPSICISKFQHSKRVEFLTDKVESFWHFVTSKVVTLIVVWQSAVNRFSGATLAKQIYFNTGAV